MSLLTELRNRRSRVADACSFLTAQLPIQARKLVSGSIPLHRASVARRGGGVQVRGLRSAASSLQPAIRNPESAVRDPRSAVRQLRQERHVYSTRMSQMKPAPSGRHVELKYIR